MTAERLAPIAFGCFAGISLSLHQTRPTTKNVIVTGSANQPSASVALMIQQR